MSRAHRVEGNEDGLTTALLKELRARYPRLEVLRHRDITAGIPDLSITGYGQTTWWELKHARPSFKSRGIQRLTCRRLAAGGVCLYVVYYQYEGGWTTMIAHPNAITTSPMNAENVKWIDAADGANHAWVCDEIARRHLHLL